MSTEPTPTSRSGASRTKAATSSLEISEPRGPSHALIRLRLTPPSSMAATVTDTGHSPVGGGEVRAEASPRVQRRSDSNIG